MIKIKTDYSFNLIFIMAVCFILNCGFYDYQAIAVGVLMLAVIIYQITHKQFHTLHLSKTFICILVIYGLSIICLVTGIDKGTAFIGILRWLPLLVWIVLIMTYDSYSRDKVLLSLPWFGTIMVLTGLFCFIINSFKDFLWQADRFGGFFQYSNTCALFLLLCVIILINNFKRNTHMLVDLARLVILLSGLLLTGCRSIILMAFLYLIFKIISDKKYRFISFIILVSTGIAAIIAAYCFGMLQNIGRITTLFTNSSTIWGRLLYWKDGLSMLISHPFGMGYMGYYEIQGSVQTCCYTTMYVHNDWLQLALDIGIIPLLIAIVILYLQLFKGKQSRLKKEILCVIAISCLMDFHMQYLFIGLITVLCLDLSQAKAIKRSTKKIALTEDVIFSSAVMLLFIYFLVPTYLTHKEYYKNALYIYPAYTTAIESSMNDEENADKAEELAGNLLSHNPYSGNAYNVLAYASLQKGNVTDFIKFKEKVLDCKKYDIDQYNDYTKQLNSISQNSSDVELNRIIADAQSRFEKRVKNIIKNTDSLAKKLRDNPDFSTLLSK